jgi:NADP-dependent 3-hydroxy acid dehydrogenase YdfG
MSIRRTAGATAIVTGASRGFGRAIAASFVEQGVNVVGVARGDSGLIELLEEHGDSFQFEAADAADPALPNRLYAAHRPQIVVLNAGATPVIGPLDAQTWDAFSTNWHSDVRQVFNFARASLRTPLKPGSVVVSISSGAALRGSPLSGGYAGAKATIRFISAYAGTEAAARSLGLRFVAILPQLTPDTDLGAAGVAAYAERAGLTAEAFAERLGPVLTTEHAAKMTTAVATDHSYSADAYILTATELRPLD